MARRGNFIAAAILVGVGIGLGAWMGASEKKVEAVGQALDRLFIPTSFVPVAYFSILNWFPVFINNCSLNHTAFTKLNHGRLVRIRAYFFTMLHSKSVSSNIHTPAFGAHRCKFKFTFRVAKLYPFST